MLSFDDLRRWRMEREWAKLKLIQENSSLWDIYQLNNPDSIKIVYNIKTLIGSEPTFRDKTICILSLPPDYPRMAPRMMCKDKPVPFHPDWYISGFFGGLMWTIERTLSEIVVYCARNLMFDEETININSVSNCNAADYYINNKELIEKYYSNELKEATEFYDNCFRNDLTKNPKTLPHIIIKR